MVNAHDGEHIADANDLSELLLKVATRIGWPEVLRGVALFVVALPEGAGGSELDDDTDHVEQKLQDLAQDIEAFVDGEPERQDREKGDDDGVEYGDPRDEKEERDR